MTSLGATDLAGLAATVPGSGVGQLLGQSTHRFAVQAAYVTPGAARLGSFTLGTDVLTEVSWQDITSSVDTISWEYGNSAGQRPIAGQLSVTLRNDDKAFSPSTANSYFAPGTLVRVVAGDPTSLDSVQFTGITQSWGESFNVTSRYVQISALDPLFLLGQVNDPAISPIGAGENLSARVDRILAAANFPFTRETNYGSALSGSQTFQATSLASESLTELFLTVDSVDGAIFCTKAGKLEVVERSAAYVSSSYVLGSNVGIVAGELGTANDDEILLSQVSLARVGGTALTFTQSGFAARYHPHSFSRNDLITQADADLAVVASGLLARGTQTHRPVSCQVVSRDSQDYTFLRDARLFMVVDIVDDGVTFNDYSICRLSHTVQVANPARVVWGCTVEFEPTASSTRS